MSRRHAREIYFVCSSISNSKDLISQIIPSQTPAEASALFLEQNHLDAQIVHGPFYKKKTQVLETTRSLQFASPDFKKAEYNGWLVNAFTLVEPANHAYLIFLKRIDGKNIPTPKGTFIAPISDLRFNNE
jgi:hypothetical protein